MELREKKVIESTVTVGCKCDGCGKESRDSKECEQWHDFSAGNCDYESDWEYLHACSVKCFIQLLDEYLKRLDGYSTAKISEFELPFAKLLYDALLTSKEISITEVPEFIKLAKENEKLKNRIDVLQQENQALVIKIAKYSQTARIIDTIVQQSKENV